jgi:tRNA nucleotidyltransferase (CCA-adding enzyme)
MRAVRFSSQLGFEIASETADAIHKMIPFLNGISAERIRVELDKLICGENCIDVLLNFSDVISGIIPEFSCCIGFDQHSDFHRYNVWEHIVRAMSLSPKDDVLLRRSLLFHDIGKPACAKFDENGKGHFKGHAEVSADMAEKIMKRLRYDKKSIEETAKIIRFHSEKINGKIETKRFMSAMGERLFFKLVAMKKCDNSAKNEFVLKQNEPLDEALEFAKEILENGECFTLRQLAVNGNDLLALGISGTEIGTTLENLLKLVIDEKLENNRESLLNFIERR